jgi:hypothetical protein
MMATESFADTVKLPAIFMLVDGRRIAIQTKAQLTLLPAGMEFCYVGIQDGVAFYLEGPAS